MAGGFFLGARFRRDISIRRRMSGDFLRSPHIVGKIGSVQELFDRGDVVSCIHWLIGEPSSPFLWFRCRLDRTLGSEESAAIASLNGGTIR